MGDPGASVLRPRVPPVSAPGARFAGCWGWFLCGEGEPGGEDSEESICLAGLYKGVLSDS